MGGGSVFLSQKIPGAGSVSEGGGAGAEGREGVCGEFLGGGGGNMFFGVPKFPPRHVTVGCTRITRTLKLFWNYLPFDYTYTYAFHCFAD